MRKVLLVGRERLGGMLHLGDPKGRCVWEVRKSYRYSEVDCSVHHITIGSSAEVPFSSYMQ